MKMLLSTLVSHHRSVKLSQNSRRKRFPSKLSYAILSFTFQTFHLLVASLVWILHLRVCWRLCVMYQLLDAGKFYR